MNPMLKKLGFSAKDRVLMIHVDDMGLSGFECEAFEHLLDAGLLVSGSVMVPCNGFSKVVAWAKQHPQADLGLHLTLTAEWDKPRWSPLSSPKTTPQLRDPL